MRPILFLLCLSFALPSAAQRFSAGMRTGANFWPGEANDPQIIKGDDGWSWDKSMYGRYESKGRFAYELGLAHTRFNYSYAPRDIKESHSPSYRELNRKSINDLLEMRASAQFRVTNTGSKFKNHCGISVSYGILLGQHGYTAQIESTNELVEHKMELQH